jgi:toxin-antitoxin system PIN domain toxin
LTSIDTNILLYALNSDCVEHGRARDVVEGLAASQNVVICELVLVELYLLLRNPAVLNRPFEPEDAVAVCLGWRDNPHWRLVESAPIMTEVWKHAGKASFARRKIIDARLALTLRHHGVTTFVTRNANHFADFGFHRVWNPLD